MLPHFKDGGQIPNLLLHDKTQNKSRRFYVQNGLLFGFDTGDPAFHEAMAVLVKNFNDGRTGFFVGGPQDFSQVRAVVYIAYTQSLEC